jgi:16S rRNA (cytosine967-C5)-methyltransferase
MSIDQQSGTRHNRSNPGIDVRRTALDILRTIEQRGLTLDAAIQAAVDQNRMWPRRDRALLNALVYGVLRWRSRLDYIIKGHSKVRLTRIDPDVLNILRIGLFQIVYLSRIPNAAAVNTSVELVKSTGAAWVVGFVNAVLRNAAQHHQDVVFPDFHKDPIESLAVRKSFPQWLIRRWLEQMDIKQVAALCDAINTIPAITLRTNTLLTRRDSLIRSLKNEAEQIIPTPYAPEGVSIKNPLKPIAEWSSFKKGGFQIQDEAAQLVTLLLDPQPGEMVLDACAGLGGKTGHIAQRMKNCGTIFSLDNSAEKLKQLHTQMQRLHISIVNTRDHDLSVPPDKSEMGTFNRVLLDAPCSGLGVLRRNPDAKWNLSKKQLQRQRKRQLEFLNNLAHLVKPGGILVYVVCSNEREENEDVVEGFLDIHPEFVQDSEPGAISSGTGDLMTRQGYLKTYPFPHNMDGFFSARFKRIT